MAELIIFTIIIGGLALAHIAAAVIYKITTRSTKSIREILYEL